MSDEENFFARWSRRKRSVTGTTGDQPKSERVLDDTGSKTPATVSLPPGEQPSSFDPTSLPAIESIGAGSNIQAFLAAGVPPDLTRAALRRAWSADPAIRDFIGLSENSWDFNAVGGIPGFGSVTADEVRRLLAQAVGAPEIVDPAQPNEVAPATEPVSAVVRDCARVPDGTIESQLAMEEDASAASDIAAQHEPMASKHEPAPRQRRHGGALPE